VNAVRSYAVYLMQTVWPVDLSPFYALPTTHPSWQIFLSTALLLSLSWMAWRKWKTQPWWAAAWLWYLVVLVPNIGIVQAGEQAHADRYTYLSTMMLIAGVCYGLARVSNFVAYGGAALSLVLLLASFAQTKYWRDDFALFGRMIEIEPGSPAGHNNLGFELQKAGRLPEAIPHFVAAARSPRVYGEARVNAAMGYLAVGQAAEALPFAESAVQSTPANPKAYLALGRALVGLKRHDDAQRAFSRGLELSPVATLKAQLDMEMGVLHYVAGRDEFALASFRAVLASNPGSAPARKNAGIVLGNLGRTREAIEELEKYLAAQPDDAAVRQAVDSLRASSRIAR